MKLSKRLLSIILPLSLSLSSCAQFKSTKIQEAKNQGLSLDSLAKMDAYFHDLVDSEQLAGIQTGVIKNGELVHFDTYGFATIEDSTLLDAKSLFRIFSMTKPLVSVALMQLYEQGKFQLEDPLYKHIPAFAASQVLVDSTLVPTKQPVRVIDLLRHTSGYTYGRNENPLLDQYYREANLGAATTNAEYAAKVSQLPLNFEPGTDWQYSIATNLCGYLVEVLSGESLDVYLAKHIFEPLEMENTFFKIPAEKVKHFTTGYRWSYEEGLFVAQTVTDNAYVREVTLFNGGGGLVSSTLDYLNFCQMMLNQGDFKGKRLLKKETVALMFQDHLQETTTYNNGEHGLPDGEGGFGLGFAIRGTAPDSLEHVYGWGGAVGTYFKINLDYNLAYVMMIQLSPHSHLGLRQRLQDFVEGAIEGV